MKELKTHVVVLDASTGDTYHMFWGKAEAFTVDTIVGNVLGSYRRDRGPYTELGQTLRVVDGIRWVIVFVK